MTNPNKVMVLVRKHPNIPGDHGWYLQIHPSLIKTLGWDKPNTMVVMEAKDDKMIVEEWNE